MDYFMCSIFADPTSNNAILRMQTAHTGMPLLDEEEQLKRFVGVEFALVHAIPPDCFVIQKRERLSPTEVRPLASYFIMNNWIYCAPDIYSVLSGRLRNSLQQLRSSLEHLQKYRPEFTPRTGYSWDITQKAGTTSQTTKTPLETGRSEEGDTNVQGDDSAVSPPAETGSPAVAERASRPAGPTTAKPPAKALVPAKNQYSALTLALQTTNTYLAQRRPQSIIPVVTDQPVADAMSPYVPVPTSQPGASTGPTNVSSGSGAVQTTIAGSATTYTPSGVGVATGGTRSVSAGAAGVAPGTPAMATSPGPAGVPGVAGQGKKKKRRQATAALRAALGTSGTPAASGALPSAGSPQSPTEP
ncbi:Mediator of RNA polymerase II transcription subunit 6 [Tulasnella sp. 403]|nr:Mediator of RNA polymerase II transcription subunit 6 [Tulasnella sp. 403]